MLSEALLAFFAMAALDFVFARYTITLIKKHIYVAGAYASVILLLNATVTLAYVYNPIMMIPAAAGAFVGTVIGGKLDKWFA
jgi:hypothetical protein